MLTQFWTLGTWKTVSYEIMWMSQFITTLFHQAKLNTETYMACSFSLNGGGKILLIMEMFPEGATMIGTGRKLCF